MGGGGGEINGCPQENIEVWVVTNNVAREEIPKDPNFTVNSPNSHGAVCSVSMVIIFFFYEGYVCV